MTHVTVDGEPGPDPPLSFGDGWEGNSHLDIGVATGVQDGESRAAAQKGLRSIFHLTQHSAFGWVLG